MAFERVQKVTSKRTGPRLTVYANGDGYLNATGDRELGLPDAVVLLVDPERDRIALEPAADDDPDGYSVSRDDDSDGGDLRLVGALQELDVDVDAIPSGATTFLPLQFDEGGRAIADVDPLRQKATGETDPAESQVYECSNDECDREFETERGRNIHASKQHDGDEDDAPADAQADTETTDAPDVSGDAQQILEYLDANDGQLRQTTVVKTMDWSESKTSQLLTELEEVGAASVVSLGRENLVCLPGEEPNAVSSNGEDDSPSKDDVRTCAEEAETIQELADLLDVTVGQARMQARLVDVDDELDDEVAPMGVSDDG